MILTTSKGHHLGLYFLNLKVTTFSFHFFPAFKEMLLQLSIASIGEYVRGVLDERNKKSPNVWLICVIGN
jgi:hypothetical protein